MEMIGTRAAPELPPAGVPKCSRCDGKGELRMRIRGEIYRICNRCNGRGWVPQQESEAARAVEAANEIARIAANLDNTREAWALLKLIDAEFRSDPMSVQCFDLRVVQGVRDCVAKREQFERSRPESPDE